LPRIQSILLVYERVARGTNEGSILDCLLNYMMRVCLTAYMLLGVPSPAAILDSMSTLLGLTRIISDMFRLKQYMHAGNTGGGS
jgi:hypothetical protein